MFLFDLRFCFFYPSILKIIKQSIYVASFSISSKSFIIFLPILSSPIFLVSFINSDSSQCNPLLLDVSPLHSSKVYSIFCLSRGSSSRFINIKYCSIRINFSGCLLIRNSLQRFKKNEIEYRISFKNVMLSYFFAKVFSQFVI